MTGEAEDSILTGGLKKGDVSSFDSIFRKYNRKVFYFALSYLKNKEDAEDVVQEVFMNLWRFRDQINEYYVFSKYLFKITYNATCKKFRKLASNKRHADIILNSMELEDNSTKLEVEYNNLVELTDNIINKLPTRQKEILLLSIDENLEPEKIAEKLNISKKTVENYLSVAKSTLRKVLENGSTFSLLFMYLFV